MQFTHEQEQLRATVRRWIAEQVNPYGDAWEEAEIFPAHQVGLLGLTKPWAYGGAGLDDADATVPAEALADINCGGIPVAIGVQTDMRTPALAHRGSDELCREFLAPATSGESVGCLGVSEVFSGSDVASIKTTARKDGDDDVIDGGKMWTTNGTQADFCCVLANTSDGAAHRNKSLIVVPMKTRGVEVTKTIRRIGMDASDTAQRFFFDGVRVPQRFRIGDEGMGFMYQMQQLQIERLCGALNNCAVAQRAIAELQTEVEALRALSWKAVERVTRGEDATRLATMAKLEAGRLAREVADGSLQVWGGMGYVKESQIARVPRDARLTSIGGCADEVMLQIPSKFMGTFPKD